MAARAILIKELLQTANRKRTYVVRAALPVGALVLLAPGIIDTLERIGQDWRAVAALARPMFVTSAWLQLVAFSLLAALLVWSAFHGEWNARTMEVLCATPITHAGIVYGKFAGVVGGVLAAALALLPVTGVVFRLGRVPREMALGSLAVIVGSAILCGSLAAVIACATKPGRRLPATALVVVAPYLAVIGVNDYYMDGLNPWLTALIPPHALYVVLQANIPGGWPVGVFGAVSLAASLGASIVALTVGPRLFAWTVARHFGARGAPKRMARLFRSVSRKRGSLGDRENPLVWVEKGPPNFGLRWGVWWVYGAAAFFYVLYALKHDAGFLDRDAFYLFNTYLGMLSIVALSMIYGACVFAREKFLRRSQLLLLTGLAPRQFVRSKIRALYRVLWIGLLTVAVVTAVSWWRTSAQDLRQLAAFWSGWWWTALGLAGFLGGALGLAAALRTRQADRRARWFLAHFLVGGGLAALGWLAVLVASSANKPEMAARGVLDLSLILLGPGAGAVIGIAFSVLARRPVGAVIALAASVGVGFATYFALVCISQITGGGASLPSPESAFWMVLGPVLVVLLGPKRWRPWRLSLLLGLLFWLWAAALASLDDCVRYSGLTEMLYLVVLGAGFVLLIVWLWYFICVRLFDAGIRGDPAYFRAGRRVPYR